MAAIVAESRALRALATLWLVACAGCTRDFDGLFSQGSSGTSGTPVTPLTCAQQGKDCVVVCDTQRSCGLTCPAGSSCTMKCGEGVTCSCSGAGCSVVCTDTETTRCSGDTTVCNRACP